MSVETLRYRSGGVAVVAVLCLVTAALAGMIAGSSLTAILSALGLAAAVVTFAIEPFVGVVILAAAVPMENLFIVAPGLTALKALGALLAFVWFFRKLLRGEPWKPLLSAPLTLAAALFLAFVLASSIWADSTGATLSGFVQLCMMFAWCMLIVDLVDSRERLEILIRVLVVSAAAAAVLTVGQGLAGANRAGDDIAGSVNATAVMLLALMPFAFYLLRASESAFWRVVGFLYIPVSCIAIFFTFSRMVLLLVGPVLLWLGWQTVRGGRGRGWLLTLLAMALLGSIPFVPWDRVERRVETIPEYVEGVLHPVGRGLSQYSGRGYHMKVAIEMGLDHPIAGVGYNNYGRRFIRSYQYEVRGAPKLFGSFRSPHSGWPGIFAELGGIGVLLWAVVLAVVLKGVGRLWLDTRGRGPSFAHTLVQGLLVSLLLYTIPYGFYFQTHKEKLLWALMALVVVTHRLHTPRNEGIADPRAADRKARKPRRQALISSG